MSQFPNTSGNKTGELDVYTGLLAAALLILLIGIFVLIQANSAMDGGGIFTAVS